MSNEVRVEKETQHTFGHQLHEPLLGEVKQQEAPSTHKLCRSSRICHILERYEFLMKDDEPTNYKEAMRDIDSERWLEAIKSEMDSLYEN